jgi:uncharacterized protein
MSADSSETEFQSRFNELRGMLACPACQGDLRLESENVVCERCGRNYPIVDGIPVLIPQA